MKKLKYILPILKTIFSSKNWIEVFTLSFLPREIVFRFKNGLEFKINNFHNLISLYEIFIKNEYLIKKLNPKIVIDIGANFGDSTVFFAKTYPKSFIFSFEPSLSTFKILKTNINLNNIENCKFFKLGVGSKRGKYSFFENKQSGLSSLYQTGVLSTKITVDIITLLDIFKINKINSCDLLKLDCEGAEFDIIMNSPVDIFSKVNSMIIEYHNEVTDYKHTELVKYLKKLKFKVRIKKHRIERNIGMIYASK